MAALGGGVLGSLWLWKSGSFPARFLRARILESRRSVLPPPFVPNPQEWNARNISMAWIGHSTVLINFFGVWILTDPAFSNRVGIDVGVGTLGPKRFVSPALALRDLPPIDLVLLSHSHMDHTDIPSLVRLPSSAQVISARETKDLLVETPFRKQNELDWGDSLVCHTEHGDVRVDAIEVRHWGARMRTDTFRGYNGYILTRQNRSILFAGDTASTCLFRDVKARGPFDIGIMPIGAYRPWIDNHCTPEEAVQMANDAGAYYIVPIHHSTFPMSEEPILEPIERLRNALQKTPDRLAIQVIGQTFVQT